MTRGRTTAGVAVWTLVALALGFRVGLESSPEGRTVLALERCVVAAEEALRALEAVDRDLIQELEKLPPPEAFLTDP